MGLSAASKRQLMQKKSARYAKEAQIKKSGSYKGKSNKLGYGGRSAQLHDKLAAKGMSEKMIGGIIGKMARKAHAAPGQKNYHGKRGKG